MGLEFVVSFESLVLSLVVVVHLSVSGKIYNRYCYCCIAFHFFCISDTCVANQSTSTDHSELFYNSLEHMHSINPYTVEILAFPFDHPNITTTSCIDDLRAIEKRKGRKIHVMKPVEINGPNTHPVFKYLKKLFDIEEMEPNYAHYFFINPDGDMVELHRGASYNALKTFIDMHVKEDLRVKKKWEL